MNEFISNFLRGNPRRNKKVNTNNNSALNKILLTRAAILSYTNPITLDTIHNPIANAWKELLITAPNSMYHSFSSVKKILPTPVTNFFDKESEVYRQQLKLNLNKPLISRQKGGLLNRKIRYAKGGWGIGDIIETVGYLHPVTFMPTLAYNLYNESPAARRVMDSFIPESIGRTMRLTHNYLTSNSEEEPLLTITNYKKRKKQRKLLPILPVSEQAVLLTTSQPAPLPTTEQPATEAQLLPIDRRGFTELLNNAINSGEVAPATLLYNIPNNFVEKLTLDPFVGVRTPMDREQTRIWMRKNGLNPYSYEGRVRRAIRNIYNGYGTENDISIVKEYPELAELLNLKNGGHLIPLHRKGKKVKSRYSINNRPTIFSNPIARLQDSLWRNGFYGKGVSYQRAVDGKMGPMTIKAMKARENARKNPLNNFKSIIHKGVNLGIDLFKAKLKHSEQDSEGWFDLKNSFNSFTEGIGARVKNLFGGEETKLLWNLKGKALDLGSEVLRNTVGRVIIDPLLERAFDNSYLYSYGDKVKRKNGEEIPYIYGITDILPGDLLIQTTANDKGLLLGQSLLGKTFSALFMGKDPRQEAAEEIANLNLNTPEGIKRFLEIMSSDVAKGMVGKYYTPQGQIDPKQTLYWIRARQAAHDMYLNRPDKWGIFEVNPDSHFGLVGAKGGQTYRLKDPKMREQYYNTIRDYWKKNKAKVEAEAGESNGPYYLGFMGPLGNDYMTWTNPDGSDLTFLSGWDMKINPARSRTTYIGEKIGKENKIKGNTGRVNPHMTEQTDNLVKKIKEEEINPILESISTISNNSNFEGLNEKLNNFVQLNFGINSNINVNDLLNYLNNG